MSATMLAPAPRRRAHRNLSLRAWPPAIALFAAAAIGALFVLPGAPGSAASPLASRTLRFHTAADGAVTVTTGAGAPVATLAAADQSFGHGFVHTLAVLRARYGVSPERPYRLALLADGRLLLTDPFAPVAIDIESFGPTNARQIAAWLGPSR